VVVAPVVVTLCPSEEVTVYPVISEPPLSVGAVHDTSAVVLPAVAVTAVGVPGTAAGVFASEASDVAELPAAFVATAVKVYAVPLSSPVKVALVAPVVVMLCPPEEVTV